MWSEGSAVKGVKAGESGVCVCIEVGITHRCCGKGRDEGGLFKELWGGRVRLGRDLVYEGVRISGTFRPPSPIQRFTSSPIFFLPTLQYSSAQPSTTRHLLFSNYPRIFSFSLHSSVLPFSLCVCGFLSLIFSGFFLQTSIILEVSLLEPAHSHLSQAIACPSFHLCIIFIPACRKSGSSTSK